MSRYAQYPPEWDLEPTWVTCSTCKGDCTVRDTLDLDTTCPDCHGDGGVEP